MIKIERAGQFDPAILMDEILEALAGLKPQHDTDVRLRVEADTQKCTVYVPNDTKARDLADINTAIDNHVYISPEDQLKAQRIEVAVMELVEAKQRREAATGDTDITDDERLSLDGEITKARSRLTALR